jgi:predicted O-linked N-acetylglucosamine transferase (SPINDLY family)
MTPADRLQTLRGAVAALAAGRLREALDGAAPVLAADPGDGDARALVRAAGLRAEDPALVDAATAVLLGAGAPRLAAEVRAAAVQRDPTSSGAWSALAVLQEQCGDPAASERTLRQGMGHAADPVALRCQLALLLARQDRADAALAEAEAARAAAPERLHPVWTALRCLPLVHASQAALEAARVAHEGRLGAFEAAVAAAGPTRARVALGFAQDLFPAHYACRTEDTALQARYGAAVHRLVATGHPELAAPLPRRPAAGRLRVGFVSSLLRRHTVAKLFGPWITGLDPACFEVHVWQLGRVDDTTRALAATGATLHTAAGAGPAAVGRAIRAAGLDAVVFPELGMDGRVLALAAMRLAPFQAVGWGHPVTTGLPTVDAFLSSEDMERPGADPDYTERLVRLPGLGTGFVRPPPPPGARSRADLGLPDGAPVLLCTQSVVKLLPRQDAVFRRILAEVPGARLVHLALPGAARFRERLAAAGLPMDRVHMLGPLSFGDFLDLNAVSDVVLDGLDWSGGVTALEAVACGRVPITLEGPLMRTRHTAAILRRLGLPELVAPDPDAYVALAVRMATDRPWRAALEARAAAAAPGLYGDPRSTEALAALLEAHRG